MSAPRCQPHLQDVLLHPIVMTVDAVSPNVTLLRNKFSALQQQEHVREGLTLRCVIWHNRTSRCLLRSSQTAWCPQGRIRPNKQASQSVAVTLAETLQAFYFRPVDGRRLTAAAARSSLVDYVMQLCKYAVARWRISVQQLISVVALTVV